MEGRELDLLDRLVKATERNAEANEKIVELATQERAVGDEIASSTPPPFCPHCQALDPPIQTEGGGGRISEFVLFGRCGFCSKVIFGLSVGWEIYADEKSVRDALKEREQNES